MLLRLLVLVPRTDVRPTEGEATWKTVRSRKAPPCNIIKQGIEAI